jgi:dTDP-4-amino-4,6-dideoxygalactose transaminase
MCGISRVFGYRRRLQHDSEMLEARTSRLDCLQCRALSIKLARLDDWNESRLQAASWCRQYLPADVVLVAARSEAWAAHHLAVVQLPDGFRDDVGALLDHNQIGWGIHYPVPCHLQFPFNGATPVSMPVTEAVASRIISLPMHPHLNESDVMRVAEVLGGHSALA